MSRCLVPCVDILKHIHEETSSHSYFNSLGLAIVKTLNTWTRALFWWKMNFFCCKPDCWCHNHFGWSLVICLLWCFFSSKDSNSAEKFFSDPLFHVQFLTQNISDFFVWDAYMVTAISFFNLCLARFKLSNLIFYRRQLMEHFYHIFLSR